MREAEIQDLGYSFGGSNISNGRYADDTALIAQSPMESVKTLVWMVLSYVPTLRSRNFDSEPARRA